MAESSLPWTDGIGDGGPYAANTWDDLYRYLFTQDNHSSEGVLKGVDGELAVTGTSSPVTVATGAAIVNGKFYKNTAVVEVTVPTPTGATRIDRIVLRADYTAQTVRIARLAGTEGSGTPPSLTQADGMTWEISLAQVSITTGGVITVTDEREFCHFATKVRQDMIDDGAVGTAQLASSAVTSAKLSTTVAGAGLTGGGGSALAINTDGSTLEVSGDQVQVKDGGVTNAKLAASCKRMKGEIIMWSGNLGTGANAHYPVDPDTGSVNRNWHICNGDTENGVVTPDLQDRFIVAQGSTYSKGNTGGAASHTHTVNIASDLGGSHSHTIPWATHTLQPKSAVTGNWHYAWGDSETAHNHGGSTESVAHHQHGVNGTTGSASTLPPYYCLIFLCYVGS
jgi:hypothetical protein